MPTVNAIFQEQENRDTVLWGLSTSGRNLNQTVTFAVGILYLTCTSSPRTLVTGAQNWKRGRRENTHQ